MAVYLSCPCEVCKRASRGFGFTDPTEKDGLMVNFCSRNCQETYFMAHKQNKKLLPVEATAALEGGTAAGKYLEQLGKTDMAAMSVAEWKEFCDIFFEEACASLARQAKEQIPF